MTPTASGRSSPSETRAWASSSTSSVELTSLSRMRWGHGSSSETFDWDTNGAGCSIMAACRAVRLVSSAVSFTGCVRGRVVFLGGGGVAEEMCRRVLPGACGFQLRTAPKPLGEICGVWGSAALWVSVRLWSLLTTAQSAVPRACRWGRAGGGGGVSMALGWQPPKEQIPRNTWRWLRSREVQFMGEGGTQHMDAQAQSSGDADLLSR